MDADGGWVMQSPQSVPCWSSWSEEPSHSCRCRPLLLSRPCPTWCQWLWNILCALLQHCRQKVKHTNFNFIDLSLCPSLGEKTFCFDYACLFSNNSFLYLQWTTIGPAEGGLDILTLRMKERSPVAWYGTPWSGQPVKWNCLTSRTSLKPRWVKTKKTSLSKISWNVFIL